jgi:hypothetical protein
LAVVAFGLEGWGGGSLLDDAAGQLEAQPLRGP